MLDKNAAERAILHLSELGDTDIFPTPFEFKFYGEETNAVSSLISNLDVAQYKPKSCIEALIPKSQLSFRIVHQLYPADSLLYTSAVIQIAPSIEEMRPEVEKGPFSYRFIGGQNEARLFSSSFSFHDWLLYQKEVLSQDDPFSDVCHVIETDISDFYARVYFHRIEHVLDDCGAPNSPRKVIEGIIKFSRARQSHGLPVGTAASRMLAEGLLSDTDRMVAGISVLYTRYVDDFRIVVKGQSKVHSTLCRLAEHLMISEGLSLNAAKTKTYSAKEAPGIIDRRLSDIFTDNEMVKLGLYIRAVYDGEEVSIEDIEDVKAEDLIEKLSEIINEQIVDYAGIKVILRALRTVQYNSPIEFVRKFSSLLYYVPRDFCLAVGAMVERSPESRDDIANILNETLRESPYAEMIICKLWVASLFVSQILPVTSDTIAALRLGDTALERRYKFLLNGIIGDRSFFRDYKTKFDQVSDWEKPALMFGASCLSKGEYSTWLDTIKDRVNDPFSDIYRKWLVREKDSLFSKLKESFVVKSREDRLIEKFSNLMDDDIIANPPPF